MALSTSDCESQPDRARGSNAIEDAVDSELLRINTAFLIDLSVAMKAGRNTLIIGGFRQEVARQLFDRKLIERHIAIQGIHNPVTVLPDLSWSIDRIAIAVRIASLIQPPASPAFSVSRTLQKPIHNLLVSRFGVRFRIRKKLFDF